MKTTFAFGVTLSLVSLPVMVLAFPFHCYPLFAIGLAIGAFGAFCCALSVILKLASLLFGLK